MGELRSCGFGCEYFKDVGTNCCTYNHPIGSGNEEYVCTNSLCKYNLPKLPKAEEKRVAKLQLTDILDQFPRKPKSPLGKRIVTACR